MRHLLFFLSFLISYGLSAQPFDCNASFLADGSGCEVNFVEASYSNTGSTVDTWTWDFGDGNTSTDQNPFHQYSTAGNYVVSLSITTTDGCGATASQTIWVDSCAQQNDCYAGFTLANNYGCEVNLTDNSFSSLGNIVSWLWDFGDGNTSTAQNPTHHYTADGSYTISLTVSTSDGCGASASQTVQIDNCSPQPDCQASFSAYTYGNCEINFTDQSYSNSANIVSWNWDFGDGNTSTDQNPVHHYGAAGFYTITLTISSSDGCSATETQQLSVDSCNTQPNCQASFGYFHGSATGTGNNCEVFFTDQSYSSNANIISWYWDFGDGATSSMPNPVHQYTADGTYAVTLHISTADSCFSTASQQVSVDNCNPQPDCQAIFGFFHGNAAGTGNACEIHFTDQSYSSSGSIVNWFWDFGDGTTSSSQNPIHQYSADGTYSVKLSIFTADSCYAFDIQQVSVDNCNNQSICQASFYHYSGASAGTSGCEVYFTDNSYSSSANIVNWHWDFGDGNTSNTPNPVHQYAADGNYTVILHIATADSCFSTETQQVSVANCTPQPDCQAIFGFYHGNAAGTTGNDCEIHFSDQSYSSTGSIVSWFWEFGDGNTSYQQNPVHQYTADGNYTVKLSISTTDSCFSFTTQPVNVDNCTPQPDCQAIIGFSYGNPAGTGNSCEVHFNDLSYSSTGTIVSWFWEFGDGSTSYQQNPVHQYTADGNYNVKLSISTTDSCFSFATKQINVDNCTPLPNCRANFNFQDSACHVFFQDMSVASAAIYSYYWDFGDGAFSFDTNPVHQYFQPGTYTVSLSIATADSCYNTRYRQITVANCSPNCKADFIHIFEPDCKVAFKDNSHGSSPAVKWQWSFGDGHSSQAQNPVHRYEANGEYKVSLIATTEDNCQDTISHLVKVNHCVAPCKADFRYIISDQLVYFKDRSQGDIKQWLWEFGDGRVSSQPHPIHHYQKSGVYRVRLTIVTKDGCRDRIDHTLIINGCDVPCKADFAFESESGCSFAFTNFSRANSRIVSYHWDFGDGTTSDQEHPNHQFLGDGVFEVSLTIKTEEGCSSWLSHTVMARNCEPSLDCRVTFRGKVDPEDPMTYHFNGFANTRVSTWQWNFGDGNTSHEPNPVHTYTEPGAYEVTLVVTNSICQAVSHQFIKVTETKIEGRSISTQTAPELLSDEAELHPNPTTGLLKLEANFKQEVQVKWEIVDLLGKRIMGGDLAQPASKMNKDFDISELSQGVYFFQLKSEEGLLFRKKVVKF
jgi:PKD repeat protein